MNYISKAVAVASLSLFSVNAFATENPLDAVRDDLKTMYDGFNGANTWTGDDYTEARDAIKALAEYGDQMSEFSMSFDFNSGFSITWDKTYSETEFQGLVDGVTDGVMTDLFGGTEITEADIFTQDANGKLAVDADLGGMIESTFEDNVDDLNDAIDNANGAEITDAVEAFNTDFSSINTGLTAYDTNFTALDKLVLEQGAAGARDSAISVGAVYSAANQEYVSGTGDDAVCYTSYENYAKGDSKASCAGTYTDD